MRGDAALATGTALLLGLAAAGATVDERPGSGPDEAEVPSPPPRIVSTNLPSDEILLALDPPTRIVAVSTFADDPAVSNVVQQARRVPHRVTGDAEPILALRPGTVFAFPFGQGDTEALLRQAGVPIVHVPDATTVERVRSNIRSIGQVVGREAQADKLIARMDATLTQVRRRVEGADRPRALLWNRGGFTSGADTLFDELLRIAGGQNVAAEAGLHGLSQLPTERALALDPEVLFVVDYRADARARSVVERPPLADDPLWAHVRAVRHGRVHYLPERHLLSSSHHAAKAAVDLARQLHPERFDHAGAAPLDGTEDAR